MVFAHGSTAELDGGEEEVSIFVNGVPHYNYLTHRQSDDITMMRMMTRMDGGHRCTSTLTHRVWFLNKHILVGNGQGANSDMSVLVVHNDISKKWSSEWKVCRLYHVLIALYLSVSCILPVCPCSAAVQHHFHICGGGSSCKLCSAGHASPCFPPKTPHVWLLYLIDTHRKEATGSDLSCQELESNCVFKWAAKLRTKVQRKWKTPGKICEMICGAFY